MKPATSSDSASTRSNGRPVGLGQRRDEEDDEHRQQRQPVPVERRAGRPARVPMPDLLRIDDVGEVERADAQDHGDDDEADRHLVGHHLRGRAQRAHERILRVRRPAAHDDAVDGERGQRQQVEDADVEVGDHPLAEPVLVDRDHRPGGEREGRGGERRQQEHALVGAGRDDRLLEGELQKVGERLEAGRRRRRRWARAASAPPPTPCGP